MKYQTMVTQKESLYFPNLNSLRFVAAAIVLVGHTEQVKGYHNFKCYYEQYPFIFKGGHLAVIFFFVLSGFLITHIISRQLLNNNFSVSDFYKKRIVRIWPLYFFITITGIYVIPRIPAMAHRSEWIGSISMLSPSDLMKLKIFYFLVLPNIAIFWGVIQYLGHLWSIGVEEQFYLIWPLLLKKFPTRLLELLLGVILSMWTLRLCSYLLSLNQLYTFLGIFRIDSMALGGIGAAILLRYPSLKPHFLNLKVELTVLITVFVLYFLNIKLGPVSDEIYSILFSIIILNAAANPNTILRFEKIKSLNYFGTISYGMYMYHAIIGMLALIIFQKIHPSYMSSLSSNLIFYALVFVLNIAVAAMSYELIEKRILKWGREKWLSAPSQPKAH